MDGYRMTARTALIAVVAVIMAIASSYTEAQPEIAAEFYGSLIMNSSNASASTNVSAYNAATGKMCGSFIVQNQGYYGLLSCSEDESYGDSSKPKNGDKISFRVNNTNAMAKGNTSWYSGMFKNINLTSPNHEPVLAQIGSRTATAGVLFSLDADATDQNNDTLTYSINTTAFSISSITGIINFTPVAAQIGNYSINLTASDGFLEDHEVFLLEIQPSPFCGDKKCINENCMTCPSDCGSCPTGTGTGTSTTTAAGAGAGLGGAGGAGGVTSKASGQIETSRAAQRTAYFCQEKWICAEWSQCQNSEQKRTCTDQNSCGTSKNKPPEKQPCKEEEKPSCSDGIKNGDEKDVDCGGSCSPCSVKKFAEAPPLPGIGKLIREGGKIAKQLPALFIAIIAAITIATMALDNVYVRRITRKEYEQYKRSLRKYKAFKRQAHKFLINLIIISTVATLYIYYFSDCVQCMARNAYIPAAAIISTPAIVAFAISRYQYSEYAKAKRHARLALTHDMQIRKLVRAENHTLLEIEQAICSGIEKISEDKTVSEAVNRELKPIYEAVKTIMRLHKGKAELQIPEEIIQAAAKLAKNSALNALAKPHPEFYYLIKSLLALQKQPKTAEDYFYIHGDAKDSVERIASDGYLMETIKSDKEAIKAYNELVDIYGHCKEVIQSSKKEGDDEMSREKQISMLLEKFFISKIIIPVLQTKNELIIIYNGLIDIYNHYEKKQGIYEAVMAERK